jgi:glutathione S-transferase
MADYLLYGFAQSGNAYKPALYLELAGADWTPRFVDFFNGETRTPGYRAINVMGEVPVLEHKGETLSQSGVILDYLVEQFGKYGWNDNSERREILRLLQRIRSEPRWRHPYQLLPGHPIAKRA